MEIKENKIKMAGQVRVILNDATTGNITKDTGWVDNVIPTIARVQLAKLLVAKNTKANAGKITYCAVGTGTTLPSVADTTLETEIDRISISTASNNDGTEAQIRAFFSQVRGNGALKELGLFGEEATASSGTGTLFQRIAFDVEKTSGETMTILSKIPIEYN